MTPQEDTEPRTRHNRREFLRWFLILIGLGSASWAGWRFREKISSSANRLRVKLDPPNSPQTAAPAEPAPPVILPHEKDYAEFLSKIDLRYITPREVLTAHRRERNGISNTLPPRQYWTGMIPTLKMADELRARLGVRLNYITSAYRSPEYNAQCPGASPRSYHTKNIALDLVYDCAPEVAMAEAKKMREEGLFRGGLGLYKTFIHLDTRGRNATWG